ncbi:hypothetical protein [Salmonella phage NINP13076]|nr:hypothetical protein [Salmonella phage NINP13076]
MTIILGAVNSVRPMEVLVDPMTQTEIKFADGSHLPPGWEVDADGRINLPVAYTGKVRAILHVEVTWILDFQGESLADMFAGRPVVIVESQSVDFGSHETCYGNQISDFMFVEQFDVDITSYAMTANSHNLGLAKALEIYFENRTQYNATVVGASARISIEGAVGHFAVN